MGGGGAGGVLTKFQRPYIIFICLKGGLIGGVIRNMKGVIMYYSCGVIKWLSFYHNHHRVNFFWRNAKV